MKQAQIKELHTWLNANYSNPKYSRESIAETFGISVKTLERHVRKLRIQKVRPTEYRKANKPSPKPIELPEGASKTKHGYLMQVGAKTVHRMAG